jgi:hypothetical protein
MQVKSGAHINPVSPGLRQDGGPNPFHVNNIWVQLEWNSDRNEYTMRIADKDNVEFHVEVVFNDQDLTDAKNEKSINTDKPRKPTEKT